MKEQSSFKPTYNLGYKGKAKTGEVFEVVEYNGRKNILIRFICGFEKNTTSTHIKQNKVTFTKKILKCKIGDKFPTKQGGICEVIGVESNTKVKVEFDNGETKHYSYLDLTKGVATDSVIRFGIPKGEVFATNSFGDVTVTKYNNALDVEVVFSDGTTTSVFANALRRGSIGHPKSGTPEGYTFTNGDGVKGEVYKFHAYDNVDVLWEDGIITKGHRATTIKRGSLYYPNFKSLVGVGYFGIGKYKPNRSGKNINYNPVVYRKWMQMIIRCYNPYEINKDSCKAYKNVFVCDEWHNFQNFALWAESNIGKFVDGYELDKDMFGTGYLYCPEYCTLLPDQVNGFLSNNYSNKQSGLPDGVNVIHPNKKFPNAKIGYVARCHINNKREYLGYYNTSEEAGEVYKKAKEKEAKRLANLYKSVLTEEECTRLYNFKLSDIHRK